MILASPATLSKLRRGPGIYLPKPKPKLIYAGPVELVDYLLEIHAGGPGSGCHGDNCGRPSTGVKKITAPSLLKKYGWKKTEYKVDPYTKHTLSTFTHPKFGKISINHDKQTFAHIGPTGFTQKYGTIGKSGNLAPHLQKVQDTPHAFPPTAPAPTTKITEKPEFTFLKDAKSLGGAHDKYLFKDSVGVNWLFKPAETVSGQKAPAMAWADQLASRVAAIAKPDSYVPAKAIVLDVPGKGQVFGSIQKMVADVKGEKDFSGRSTTSFSSAEVKGLQQEQVIDWLISNHDAHDGQFLRAFGDGPDKVYGIDKSQAFKYFPGDQLSTSYHPNGVYGEKPPIYNRMFEAIKSGQLSFNPNNSLQTIKNIEAIPIAKYREILLAYSAARYPGTSDAEHDKQKAFLDAAVERKGTLRSDFEKFYSDVLGKPFQFEKTADLPSNITPGLHEKAMGAPPEVQQAVQEALTKYHTADRTYKPLAIHDWDKAIASRVIAFRSKNGREPTADERKAITIEASVGKGAYPEAAAKSGFEPYQIRDMNGTIKDWTSTATAGKKAQMQDVVDGSSHLSTTGKALAFEQAMTVAKLREAHPDGFVTLWRGRYVNQKDIVPIGEAGSIKVNGAGSWSDSKTKASGFGSYIMEAKIPVEYVISSYKTNPEAFENHIHEKEYIVAFPGKITKYVRTAGSD